MLRPEKNSYKEFDDEKKFLRLENSPPPHNFSNGPSLTTHVNGHFWRCMLKHTTRQVRCY